jgi:hypothetical protein
MAEGIREYWMGDICSLGRAERWICQYAWWNTQEILEQRKVI